MINGVQGNTVPAPPNNTSQVSVASSEIMSPVLGRAGVKSANGELKRPGHCKEGLNLIANSETIPRLA